MNLCMRAKFVVLLNRVNIFGDGGARKSDGVQNKITYRYMRYYRSDKNQVQESQIIVVADIFSNTGKICRLCCRISSLSSVSKT